MKITKLEVVDENGITWGWVGEGFISPARTQSHSGSKEPLVMGVDAHITWIVVNKLNTTGGKA